MADNKWRPHGFEVKIQGVVYDPVAALRNFVLPIKHDPNWIENSKPVTNTGLSSREWFGLALHAIALTDKTGDYFQIATENTGGDGALVRRENGESLAVLVEQTLVTHLEEGSLMDVVQRRIIAKSSKGNSYAANKHLVVLCNKPGDLNESEVAKMVASSKFNIVNVLAFQADHRGRHFLSFIFDADYDIAAVHRFPIPEPKLWRAVIALYDREQKAKAAPQADVSF